MPPVACVKWSVICAICFLSLSLSPVCVRLSFRIDRKFQTYHCARPKRCLNTENLSQARVCLAGW